MTNDIQLVTTEIYKFPQYELGRPFKPILVQGAFHIKEDLGQAQALLINIVLD